MAHDTAAPARGNTFRDTRVTAAMCTFGSPFRKYFTVMLAPAAMHGALAPLVGRWCPGAGGVHDAHAPAYGFDSQGNSRAEASARRVSTGA
ncbi:hypothetical protein AB1Y20_001272 [Prymnesium parvum]|uniref:Uncharacterized protein n=1 Tax=Prymnesium parvum TaxID=97485 RepID=A0AB34KCX7_PRYPA